MAAFRAVFGAKRSKTGEYKRKQLLRAEEKLTLKLEKIKKLKRTNILKGRGGFQEMTFERLESHRISGQK